MTNVAREHKNNVFCILFSLRQHQLSLYNAVNHSRYRNEQELTVVTLENMILLRMHNDTAFLIDRRLNLYEQQASANPNIPLRDLYYVVEEFKKLVPMKKLYGKTKVNLPTPKFITFYNGTEAQPAETVLKLSDLYEVQDGAPELELSVRQININPGYNDDILEECESLKGYMAFVCKVRDKTQAGMDAETAVPEAVDECIEEGILASFFKEHRNEVVEMGIFEFDAETHDQVLKEESWDEGWKAGNTAGYATGKTEGRAESILELLQELGAVSETLRERIMEQEDPEILRKWLMLSARVDTLEEFRAKMFL